MPHHHSNLITEETPAAYKEGFKVVAREWNEAPYIYTNQSGSAPAYVEMREEVAHRLARQPNMEEVGESVSNGAGLKVITNFFYIGAAKAALQGYSLTELISALYTPTSFNQLVPLTKMTKPVTSRIESEVGLISYPDNYLNQYSLTESGLQINSVSFALAAHNAKSQLKQEGREDEIGDDEDLKEARIRCLGMKAGLVTYAYKYLLDICTNDPSLFETTLNSTESRT